MNEFTAKKIGEVMAFSAVGAELMQRCSQPLGQIWDDSTVQDFAKKLQSQLSQLRDISNETSVTKLEKTGSKLRDMAQAYIGDEWDNPVEICEWLGFFEGAAIVHCELVKAALAAQQQNTIVLDEAIELHTQLLERVKVSLRQVGEERARQV
jgi:hypothetical protein